MTDRPIAIISYNRPDLLERFLTSLKQQTIAVDPAQIALFQDHGDPSEADCVAVFLAAFPEGAVFQADENLGVALNIDRAERYVFETLGAQIAGVEDGDEAITTFEAIAKTKEAGGNMIEFYPGQPLSPEERNVKVSHDMDAGSLQKLQDS